MAGAIHDNIRAKPADDVAHAREPLLRLGDLLDVNGRFGTEFAREF